MIGVPFRRRARPRDFARGKPVRRYVPRACALLSEPRLDEALAALCDKWGKGGCGQAARTARPGWWRLLRLAALPDDGAGKCVCEFETRAISVLSGRHDRASLAERHAALSEAPAR